MSHVPLTARAARLVAAFAALIIVTSPPTPLKWIWKVAGDSGLQPQPPQPPSAEAGAAIFSQRCVSCHGELGQGDGPMARQANLPMPDLTDPNRARAARPAAWYDVITKGSVETGGAMPPFGEGSSRPLSEQDRWNVLFYAWSLSTTPERIEQGRLIYSQRCSTCHGDDGRGQGPGAAGQALPDFTDVVAMAGRTQTDFFNAISQGQGTDQAMPAFASVLSEDERWAVADYVRAFSYVYAPPAQPRTLPEARRYTITGPATNATTGASLPAGMPITLHVYNAVSETATFTTTVGADGSYRFSDVLIPHGAISEVEARQDYAPFYTAPFTYPLTTDVLTIPVEIYDLTTDPSVLRVDQWHLIVTGGEEGALDVIEIYTYANTSDRAYAPPPGAEGLQTVRFPLPADARDVQVLEGGAETTVTRTSEGLAYTLPVPPGEYRFTLSYRLPYKGEITFEQRAIYPVNGVILLAPKDVLSVSSPQFTSQSEQVFDEQTYILHRGGPMAAGSTLTLTITSPQAFPVELAVGGAVLAIALIGVGVWWWRRSGEAQQPLPSPKVGRRAGGEGLLSPGRGGGKGEVEALMQQIADLDDAYESGALDQATYEKKRAKLKRELVALMRAQE